MIASVTYNTSGSAGPYTITFDYLEETDIEVYLDGVLTTAWSIASSTQLTLDSAPTAVEIEIRRNTQDDLYVDFDDGAFLTEANLDTATRQAIYIAQEAKDSVDAETERAEAAEDDLSDQIVSLSVGSGNVPPPSNPGDDGKALVANGGSYDWDVPDVASTDITDSTSVGRSVLTAASKQAAREAIDAHLAASITSGTIAQDRLGTGSGGAGLKFLADDQTYKVLSALNPIANQVFGG